MILVVELKKPIKESQRFQEYLKSDVYMYGPLLELPPSPSPQGTLVMLLLPLSLL